MTEVSELGDSLKKVFEGVRSNLSVSAEWAQAELTILDVALSALDETLAKRDSNIRARTILTGIDAVRTALKKNSKELDSTFYQCGVCLMSAGIKSSDLDLALETVAKSLSSETMAKACDRANKLRSEVISRGDKEHILWLAVNIMINGSDHYDAVWSAAQSTFEIDRKTRVWEAETKAFESKTYGRTLKDGSSFLATPHSTSIHFADGGSVTLIGGKLYVG